jgi:hypothetical protein
MGVIGAYEDASVSAQFLESHPDICLDVFDEVADMDVPIGVGQSGGYQQFLLAHYGVFCW